MRYLGAAVFLSLSLLIPWIPGVIAIADFLWVGNSLLLQHHSWYTWAELALSTRYWQ